MCIVLFGGLLGNPLLADEKDAVLEGPALSEPAPPSSDMLMQRVRELLPRDPIAIDGRLRTRKRKGLDAQTLGVSIKLDWGASRPQASYSIHNEKGSSIERMLIARDSQGDVELDYEAGVPLEKKKAPPMTRPIQKTNVSWADLSLSFLWWKGGTIESREKVKGQDCMIVRLPAPDTENGQYHFVKLWIDSKYHVLIKAEGYNKDDQLIREMVVRSFKKINDHWMIKDLDVRSIPSQHKTTLRIEEVKAILPEQP